MRSSSGARQRDGTGAALKLHVELGISVAGFFDDRGSDRLAAPSTRSARAVSGCRGFVNSRNIDVNLSRSHRAGGARAGAVNELGDTTVSTTCSRHVWFDMIQQRARKFRHALRRDVRDTVPWISRSVSADGREHRFLALLILHRLVAIAIAVRRSSQGPVIFRQRRYGLDGQEINVYKFRTMSVCEDGANVTQAARNDRRVTAIGKHLRRWSLDELPRL